MFHHLQNLVQGSDSGSFVVDSKEEESKVEPAETAAAEEEEVRKEGSMIGYFTAAGTRWVFCLTDVSSNHAGLPDTEGGARSRSANPVCCSKPIRANQEEDQLRSAGEGRTQIQHRPRLQGNAV